MKIVKIIKKKKKQLVCFDDGLIIKTTKSFNFDLDDDYTLSYNGCFIDCNNEIVNMFSLDGKEHYNLSIINNSAYKDTMDILSSFVKIGNQVCWEAGKC